MSSLFRPRRSRKIVNHAFITRRLEYISERRHDGILAGRGQFWATFCQLTHIFGVIPRLDLPYILGAKPLHQSPVRVPNCPFHRLSGADVPIAIGGKAKGFRQGFVCEMSEGKLSLDLFSRDAPRKLACHLPGLDPRRFAGAPRRVLPSAAVPDAHLPVLAASDRVDRDTLIDLHSFKIGISGLRNYHVSLTSKSYSKSYKVFL